MSLLDIYKSYLANPKPEHLAEDSSVNYITTTTTISGPTPILKHLEAQQQQVKKKEEKILNAIEDRVAICLETETTLEFIYGGGAYLPGLDDNFLADKTVLLPITHIVSFTSDGKIRQIRLSWDQGTLLKAVETIGGRGRNWPIRDGKDQIRLITTSASATPTPAPSAAVRTNSAMDATAGEREGRRPTRATANEDKYRTLSLFEPSGAPDERKHIPSKGGIASPRASARPPPREWSELFADEGSVAYDRERSASPTKKDQNNPLKSGAGRHYIANRLFEEDPVASASPEKGVKTDPKKYEHFEFGEGEFKPSSRPISEAHKKHGSQWDFSDFETPQKPRQRPTAMPTSNIKLQDEDEDVPKSPTFAQHNPRPRKDAETHFEIADEATPTQAKTLRTHPRQKGLYEDHILGDATDESAQRAPSGRVNHKKQLSKQFEPHWELTDGSAAPTTSDKKAPLGNITNINQHSKTFEPHWEMTDGSTAPKDAGTTSGENRSKISEGRRKVAQSGMQANWSLTDDSPEQHRGINIKGNGMGSSRAAERGWWEYQGS